MKKIVIGALLLAGVATATTSCGNGDATAVNTDSIIPTELLDSVSCSLGAFYGASMQDEVAGLDVDMKEFIEGYQMMVGSNFSNSKLMGMRAGVQTAAQFMLMEQDGIKVDRDRFMQEFRNYIQDPNMDETQFAILYDRINKLQQEVMAIIEKRELMRHAKAAGEPVALDPEVVADVDSVVVVEDLVEEVAVAEVPDSVEVD